MINYKDLTLVFQPDKTIVVVLENGAEHPLKIEKHRAEIKNILSPVKIVVFNYDRIYFENGSSIYFIPYRSHRFRGIHADMIIHIDSHLYLNFTEFLHREIYPMMKSICEVKYWSL